MSPRNANLLSQSIRLSVIFVNSWATVYFLECIACLSNVHLSLYCRLFWALSSQSFLLGFLTPLLLGSSLSFINFTRVIISWGMTIDHEHELDKSPLVFYVHLFHNFTISWDTPVRIQGGISMAYTQFKISDLQYARFPFVPGCRMREEIQYEVVSTLDSSSPRWIKDCWWL